MRSPKQKNTRATKSKPKAAKTPQDVAAKQDADNERRRRIAEVAYSIGARHGFDGGPDQALEDWLEAERIVDQPKTGSSS